MSSKPKIVNTGPAKGQRNGMRMISRAAAVLRALAGSSSGLSLGQIAKSAGLPRSTVQRLVGALEAEGLVLTQAGEVGVRLGPEFLRLGTSIHADMKPLFRPHLQELHARTLDTVDLTLLMGRTPMVVDQITSRAALRVVSFVGRPLPLHATASGKAHLMAMPREQALGLLAGELKRHTHGTITSAEVLAKLAGRGPAGDFAYDRQEYEEGVCAIALPVQTLSGDNYAIALSMPTSRFQDRLPLLREALRSCQRGIEGAAGIG